MRVISVRNVHEALPEAVRLLQAHGIQRETRNGMALVAPFPVTTEYARPTERVLFWPQRDANPFFHLAESLWMISGRDDVRFLTRYVSDFGKFSDDGETLHGAYGRRWRRAYEMRNMQDDQLAIIARRLRENPDDRRCVLQMWDAEADLDSSSKDVPCNLVVSFQRDVVGALDMTVFCRSNDLIWGAYGANAVHFSLLQEYLATWIGCEVGTYWQVSTNWHAYVEPLAKIADLPAEVAGLHSIPTPSPNPYRDGVVRTLPLLLDAERPPSVSPDAIITELDGRVAHLLAMVDGEEERLSRPLFSPYTIGAMFIEHARLVLYAHQQYRTLAAPARYDQALATLAKGDPYVDWIVAAREWIARRLATWEAKMRQQETVS